MIAQQASAPGLGLSVHERGLLFLCSVKADFLSDYRTKGFTVAGHSVTAAPPAGRVFNDRIGNWQPVRFALKKTVPYLTVQYVAVDSRGYPTGAWTNMPAGGSLTEGVKYKFRVQYTPPNKRAHVLGEVTHVWGKNMPVQQFSTVEEPGSGGGRLESVVNFHMNRKQGYGDYVFAQVSAYVRDSPPRTPYTNYD